MVKWWVTLWVALGLGLAQPALPCLSVGTQLVETPSRNLSAEVRQAMFLEVAALVEQHYHDPAFNGLDWPALVQELQPRITASRSDQEFYALLRLMVVRLADGHSYFLSPQQARQEDQGLEGEQVLSGLGVATLPHPEGLSIQVVFPGSAAWEAGLKPRDLVVAVNGYRCPPASSLEGAVGQTIRLQVRSPQPGRVVRSLEVAFREYQPDFRPRGRRLGPDQAYGLIELPSFDLRGLAGEFEAVLAQLLEQGGLRGLILDLRSNPGGLIFEGEGVTRQFIPRNPGYDLARGRVLGWAFELPAGRFLATLAQTPLVLLVDRGTASTAERVSSALQQSQRATVVGRPTARETEALAGFDFEDGSRLWLAVSEYYLGSGQRLAQTGVIPDIQLEEDWRNYALEADPYLLRALEWLQAGPAAHLPDKASP